MDDTRFDLPPVTGPPPPLPGGVVAWHGRATGSWWAMLPGREGPRLVEADDEHALAWTVHWQLQMAVS
jgi:hypothetical protein